MKHTPELIVMLTHNDVTVPDAAAVFARCQHTRARYWGFKEEGLPFAEMQALFAQMKACGKTTCLEVIAYTEPECLHGAEMAAACGCDILMGTVYSDAVHAYCRAHGLRYMPLRWANFWPSLYPARHPGGDDLRGRGLFSQGRGRH